MSMRQIAEHVPALRCSFARGTLWKQTLGEAHDTTGGEPQHEQQQQANKQKTILRERREHLGKQHDHERSDQGSEQPVGTADHDDKQKEYRLQERKGFGADEARQWCEYPAGKAGSDGGKSESGGADHGRIKSDRLARHSRVPRRKPPPPSASEGPKGHSSRR